MKRSSKYLFDKRNRYSVRKLSIGICSVLIGVSVFGTGLVKADDSLETDISTSTSANVISKDKEFNTDQDLETAGVSNDEIPSVIKEVVTTTVGPETSTDDTNLNTILDSKNDESVDKVVEISSRSVNESFSNQDNAVPTAASDKQKEVIENQNLENREQDFNKDWYFKLNDTSDKSAKEVDVHDWSKLDLPHDWSIYFDFDHNSPARNEGGQLDGGVAWYRKTFTIDDANKDKDVRIHFDGVYMDSSVYVNGKLVGHYPNGYNHFSYDITDFLTKDGSQNNIAVKVINKQPSSRWYSGSGIYRDVRLSYTDKVHVVENGTKITTPKLAEQHGGLVDTLVSSKVVNNDNKDYDVYVEHQIFTKEGKAVTGIVKSEVKHLSKGEAIQFDQDLKVNNPILWSTKTYSPQLYKVMTNIYKNNQLVDTTTDTFGYRYLDWKPQEGFFLNGESLKFHGVCIHQDNGALGSEENYKATYRKLKLLKDMGVNAIRTSHNPASDVLLKVAEELGLLVQEEAFDTWYGGKKTYDYGRFFDQDATHPDALKGEKWSDFDLRTMVEKDKNNPAIIMWSLGNEVEEANGDARSIATVKRLKAIIKSIDTERYVTMGENKYSRGATGGFLRLSELLDAVGMNYGEANYDAVRKAHPNWLIYGSETSSATRTRDSYYDPAHQLAHNNGANRHYEQSDYGNDFVSWGRTATKSWTFDRDRSGYAGQFIWTGFDYIGEPTPWHNQDNTPVKSSFFGIIDTAGLPKNDFYLYMSQWYDQNEKPMVHILPHWNWTEESLADRKILVDGKVPVRTYSNASSVELFLNNESLGKKEFVQKTTSDGRKYQEGKNPNELYLEWLVDYKPGTLVAVARDKNGKEIARDQITTAGQATSVRLTKEEHVISADGKDLAYIHYEIVDAQGNVVPTANNLVHFNIHGQGKIVGVDNGEEASRERYKAQSDGTWMRRAFNGKGIIIVKSTDVSGSFTVFADSEGLASDSTKVLTVSDTKQNELISFDTKKQVVYIGSELKLPKTVTAVYKDGTTKDLEVNWENTEQLTESAGLKEILGTIPGQNEKVKLPIQVVGAKQWLPQVQVVPVKPGDADFNKTVTLVYTDGVFGQFNVKEWKLDNPSTLSKEGGETLAHGVLDGFETEVTVKFVAKSNQEEPSVSALLINGKPLEGFENTKTYYRKAIPYGTNLPTVSLETENPQITVIQANKENGETASVYVLDNAGNLSELYKVQFIEEAPSLKKLELILDKSGQLTEDDIVTYHVRGVYADGSVGELNPSLVTVNQSSSDGGKVNITNGHIEAYSKGTVRLVPVLEHSDSEITTSPLVLEILANKAEKNITAIRPLTLSLDKNQTPNLPTEVTVDFDKGLARKLPVKWDSIAPEELGHYHVFTILGHVPGTDKTATLTVSVEGDLVAEDISTTVAIGEKIKLPDSVRVYHSSGSVTYKNVIWNKVDDHVTDQDGMVIITGKVADSDLVTHAHVRVSSDVVKNDNISKQWTGSQLPAAIVSNTGGDDNASTLNDLTISRGSRDPKNRWTSWRTGDKDVWAAILFGDAGDLTKRFVDNLNLDFYTDGAINLPESYVIEYYTGQEVPNLPSDLNHAKQDTNHPFNKSENWKPVTGLLAPNQLVASKTNTFNFDKVNTYALRIRMVSKASSSGVGLTEMTILGNKVLPNDKAKASLFIDGKALPEFNDGRTVYYISNTSKEVTAEVSNNGTATIIPNISEAEPIHVIVRAENGDLINDYKIYRNDQLVSTYKAVESEAVAETIAVGETPKLPETVTVFFKGDKDWSKQSLTVAWDKLPKEISSKAGVYNISGKINGTDLVARLQLFVTSNENKALNERNLSSGSQAFASTTNDIEAASQDRVEHINDGDTNSDKRWTNWSRINTEKEVSVGVIFKENNLVQSQTIDKVGILFFSDSGTDAPDSLNLEYYDGPDFTNPNPISRYKEDTNHPFNDSKNWKKLDYKLNSPLVAGKNLELTFNPIQTKAIRARMVRKESKQGIAVVEFSAFGSSTTKNLRLPNIMIDGKLIDGFTSDKFSYDYQYGDELPKVTVNSDTNFVSTVIRTTDENLPTLVIFTSSDGKVRKEYQIHFSPKVNHISQVTPTEGEKSLSVTQPELVLTTETIPYKTVEKENPNLAKGERRVLTQGQTGERQLAKEVVKEGDKVISTKDLPSTTIKEAVDEVVEVGTMDQVSQVAPTEGEKDLSVIKPELVLSTEKVPFKTVERLNDQLAKGQRRVIIKGQDGEKLLVKEVYKEGDKILKSTDLPSLVSKEVVDEVVEVGTKVESPSKPIDHVIEKTLENSKSDKTAKTEMMSDKKETKADAPVELMSRVVKNHDEKSLPNTGDKEAGLFLVGMSLLGLGSFTAKRRR